MGAFVVKRKRREMREDANEIDMLMFCVFYSSFQDWQGLRVQEV